MLFMRILRKTLKFVRSCCNMAWLVVDGDGTEIIFEVKPKRSKEGKIWQLPSRYSNYSVIYLKKGTIEKIIGRKMTWDDEPIKT